MVDRLAGLDGAANCSGSRSARRVWPLASAFTICRGARTTRRGRGVPRSRDGGAAGAANACPTPATARRVESVAAAIEACGRSREPGSTAHALQRAAAAGAARNALDCALWDLEAKRGDRAPAWSSPASPQPRPVVTAYTSASTRPERWRRRRAAQRRTAAPQDQARRRRRYRARSAAVRAAAPRARLIVDANEGWTAATLAADLAPALAELGVELVEQPLPAGDDDGACRHAAPAAGLRRRERATTAADLDRARGPLRRGQHQARQDRRPDRGAGAARRGAGARLRDHGRLHGRHLARHGARRCWSRRAPTSSTSTGRCCSPATASPGCATTAAWSIRRSRRCGADAVNNSPGERPVNAMC